MTKKVAIFSEKGVTPPVATLSDTNPIDAIADHSSLARAGIPPCGAGAPSFPLVHLLPHLSSFYFSLSFISFTYFLLLSIPSPSTRIVYYTPFPGRIGHRKRPNVGLVCCVCVICIP